MHTVRPRRGALRAGTQRGRLPSAADLRSRGRARSRRHRRRGGIVRDSSWTV